MLNFDIDVASKFPSEAYTFPLLALIVNGFLVSSLEILMYLSPCKYWMSMILNIIKESRIVIKAATM
jgi:hypothetical protein